MEDDDSDDEEETIAAEPKQKRKDLSTLEDKTGDLASQAPTSVADFERLLLGTPNSSYLWIQYIAFYLGLSQADKAREIGQRALKSIHYREELEKLNVWVALLNLENTYGTEASLDAIFKDAAQSNDAKTIYLRLVDVYERSGKFEVSFSFLYLILDSDAHVTGGGGAVPKARQEVRTELKGVDAVWSILPHPRETDRSARSSSSFTEVSREAEAYVPACSAAIID